MCYFILGCDFSAVLVVKLNIYIYKCCCGTAVWFLCSRDITLLGVLFKIDIQREQDAAILVLKLKISVVW